MRKWFPAVAVLLILLIFLLAPWLNAAGAAQHVEDRFNSSWSGIADGCGFNCKGCGVQGTSRELLGYSVQIEYACGLLPEDSPAYHQRAKVFVSVLGTMHGLPVP